MAVITSLLSWYTVLPAIVILCVAWGYSGLLFPDRKFRKFAAENGCEEAADLSAHNRIPLNLGLAVGNVRHIMGGGDIGQYFFMPAFRKVGNTFTLSIFGQSKIIFTCEPENIKTMLATRFQDYAIEAIRDPFKVVLGRSIFTTDGPAWEHARAMFRPQFSRDLINDLDSTEKASLALFDALGDVAPGQWTRVQNIVEKFYHFSMDATTEFLFGQSVETQRVASLAARGDQTLAAQAAAGKEFSDAISTAQDWIIWRMRLGPNLFWLCDTPRFRRAVKTIHNFVGRYVDQALQEAQKQEKAAAVVEDQQTESGKKKYSLLAIIARELKDRDELRDQLMSILLAGRDTTSVLLSFMFLMMALNPHEFKKLRQAVIDDFGPDRTATSDEDEKEHSKLDFAKLKNCRYLQYFMNETLRLFPPVAENGRAAIRDTVLPTGGGPDGKSPVAIKKGTPVGFSIDSMHVREDLWGPNPAEFKPERWNGRKLGWDFLAFNGGPRVCIGQQYALTEAGYLTVRILQRYDAVEIGPSPTGYIPKGFVTTPSGKQWDIARNMGLVQSPREGVNIRLRRADASKE